MIKKIIESLKLPTNEIIFMHVRLKGLDTNLSYNEQSKQIIGYLNEFYSPKTILIPTFTYSFTKTGIYDRVHTVSEVGRFGEEVRASYSYLNRTMNPVFSVMDTESLFQKMDIDETKAFGENSYFDHIARKGFIMCNINTQEPIFSHLHYLEYKNKVDYRFKKTFPGKVSEDGKNFTGTNFEYFVRNLDMDTKWRRKKILKYLQQEKIVNECLHAHWIDSPQMDKAINKVLSKDIRFLITDE